MVVVGGGGGLLGGCGVFGRVCGVWVGGGVVVVVGGWGSCGGLW